MGITIAEVEKVYPECNGCGGKAEKVAQIDVDVEVYAANSLGQGVPLTSTKKALARLCIGCLEHALSRLKA